MNYKKYLDVIAVICVIGVIGYFFPELFDGADVIYHELLLPIQLGYLLSYMFYTITVYFPEKNVERLKILRADKVIKLYINRYRIYFNCVTMPIEQRDVASQNGLNANFKMSDMCDLHKSTLLTKDSFFDSAIMSFYKTEKYLINYMITMINNIDFKYNKKLEELLLSFIECSNKYDMSEAILSHRTMNLGSNKMADEISKLLKREGDDYFEDFNSNKATSSHALYPYALLYLSLNKERDLINEYLKIVKLLMK